MGRILAVLLTLVVLASCSAESPPPRSEPRTPVGLRQIEFHDPNGPDGERLLALSVFYPAEAPQDSAQPFTTPFFTGLDSHRDLTPTGRHRPLLLFSHGRGSNALYYAWFAEAMARRGYIVAGINHYRANTYDSSIDYLTNRLWQRPRDLTLAANHLVADEFWGPLIDPDRIGVVGHSQGGFTALWLGGARVDPDRYLAFQQGIKNNRMIPESVRAQLPLDAEPALDVADPRIRAVFAMAPGVLEDFGMTADGLAQLRVPTHIMVGARDTQTPPGPNAAFAAEHIPDAQLTVLEGDVDHEIFVNECTPLGRDEFPEACVDAPGVDRAAIHRDIAETAARFFDEHLG